MNAEFDFEEYRNKLVNGQLKDNLDAKNYIQQYFCPLTSGQHTLIENDHVTLISDDVMRKVYFKRWGKDVKKWYEEETNPIRLICEFDKPMSGNDFMNVSKQLKHKYQKFDTFSEKTKKGVQKMLSYIKEVWANGVEEMNQYLLCGWLIW